MYLGTEYVYFRGTNLDTRALTVQDMASVAIPDGNRDWHHIFLSLIREQVRSKLESLTPEEWSDLLKEGCDLKEARGVCEEDGLLALVEGAWETYGEDGLLALIEQLVSGRAYKSFLQFFDYFQVRADLYYLAAAVYCRLLADFLSEQDTLLYFYRRRLVKKKKEKYKQRTYIPLTASRQILASSSDMVAF
jgi:hypothetical protein